MAAAEEGDVAGDGEEAEAPSEGREALLAVARLLPINELVAKNNSGICQSAISNVLSVHREALWCLLAYVFSVSLLNGMLCLLCQFLK